MNRFVAHAIPLTIALHLSLSGTSIADDWKAEADAIRTDACSADISNIDCLKRLHANASNGSNESRQLHETVLFSLLWDFSSDPDAKTLPSLITSEPFGSHARSSFSSWRGELPFRHTEVFFQAMRNHDFDTNFQRQLASEAGMALFRHKMGEIDGKPLDNGLSTLDSYRNSGHFPEYFKALDRRINDLFSPEIERYQANVNSGKATAQDLARLATLVSIQCKVSKDCKESH